MPEGSVRITGMMPDGVDSVEARFRDGDTQRVAVQDNVYSLIAPASGNVAQAIEWSRGGTEHATPTSIPGDAGAGCGPTR
jgi:hypothetical protein